MNNNAIPRPNRKFKSANNNYYIKVDDDRIMLDDELVQIWDTILTITLGKAKYTQRTATQEDVNKDLAKEVGETIVEDWYRTEVTDYTTTTRDLIVRQHSVAMQRIDKELMAVESVEGSVNAEMLKAKAL